MKKKYNKSILILIILILSVGIVNLGRNAKNAIDSRSVTSADTSDIEFIYGVMYLPFTIDPQDCWDSASEDVLIQIVETLFTYDLSNPALPVIPLLAADYGTWDVTHTQYTVDLQTGVTFHDGSTFDADDVVFTFDRQAWLYNFTGLNYGYVPDVSELYEFPDHTPIINDVVKIDADTIRFELNGPYGPFEDLLCFTASSILTDTYYAMTGGIVELDGDVMGTGPFMYDVYQEDVEVVMLAFDDYWRGRAQIDKLIASGIRDATKRNAALINGDIHFLSYPADEFWDVFTDDPDITMINTGDNSSGIQYLVMNNVLINRTWREAISYAFDYNYLINTIRYGHADRLKSPVGYGIKYFNWTFPVPTYNVTKARLIMQSMGFGIGWDPTYDPYYPSADESLWTNANFRTLNYSYNIGNDVREDVFIMLIHNLGLIGIQVEDAGSTWSVVLQKVYELGGHTRNELELLFIGWGTDYNDPNCYINKLFTNRSVASNAAQYNGYTEAIAAGRDPFEMWDNVQLLMEAALVEPDGPLREAYYDRIQDLLIKDFPVVWGYCSKLTYAHHVGLTGFQQNALGWVYFYPCQWNPVKNLGIELKESTFSTQAFNLTFFVHDGEDNGIDNANIQMFWDSTNVSTDVQNLGGGVYFVSLTPIFVQSGGAPILLNMTVSASGFADKNYELELAVEYCMAIDVIQIDVIDEVFTTEAFNLTFFVSNWSGQGIDNANFQMTWDGTNVAGDVQNLGGGVYFVSLTPIFVQSGEAPILLNTTVSAAGFADKNYELELAVEYLMAIDVIQIDVVDEIFTEDAFNLTFYIYNGEEQGIDNANIQMAWDGTNVSADVQNLGVGFYFVSLESITVKPGDDPILLTMTVSASGYVDKNYELELAVDPDTLRKGAPTQEIPVITIILTISLIGNVVAIIGITYLIWRTRRKE